MRVIRSQVQYVNSLDREANEYINNFAITYPNNFIPVEPNQYVQMSLTSFSTYNYFFWTNRYNNAFNINGVVCFLPIGFYTPEDNITHFIQIMLDKFNYVVTANYQTTDNTYIWETNTNFTLSFEGRQKDNSVNAALVLGFNIGGNYPFNILESTAVTVPYSFNFIVGETLQGPSPPIKGKLQNIILQMSVPPQNVAFQDSTGYMNYTSSFAYIPSAGYEPYDPIVYNPQDVDTWTWQSPSQGSKLGTIRYILLTPNYQELPMVADYTMSIKVDIMIDDAVEQMKLMKQSLKFQKLLLLQNDQHHQDLIPDEEPEPEAEAEPEAEPEGGQQETEDQLYEGNLDYYGNNLYYD